MYKIIFIFISFLIVSCGSSIRTISEKGIQKNYSILEIEEANIGEAIINVENVSLRKAYTVAKDYITPTLGISNWKQADLIKGEKYFVYGYGKNEFTSVFLLPEDYETAIFFIEINKNGYINRGWITSHGISPIQGNWSKEQLFIESDNKVKVKSNFRSEIIYSGKEGDNIKAIYREYSENMARPAFTQELSYNLAESNLITYKKIKIEVISSTNSSIKYRVLEDGDLNWFPK